MKVSRSLRRALWPTAFASLLLAVPAGSHSAFAATRYAPGANYTAAGSQVGTTAATGTSNNGYAGPGNSTTAPSTSYSGGAGPYLPPDSNLVVPRQLLGDYTAQIGTVPSADFCGGVQPGPTGGTNPILNSSFSLYGPYLTCYIDGMSRGTNSVMGPSTIQLYIAYANYPDPNPADPGGWCFPAMGNGIITSNETPSNQLNISFYLTWCGALPAPYILDSGNFTVTGGTGEFQNATGGGTMSLPRVYNASIILNGTVKP